MNTSKIVAILFCSVGRCCLLAGNDGWSKEITGAMTSDGCWMRPDGATYEEWTFRGLDPATLGDSFKLDFSIGVTNKVDGGSGYSTEVDVTISNPSDPDQKWEMPVWLQNNLPGAVPDFGQTPVFLNGTDSKYSYGYGYRASATIPAVPVDLISPSGTLKVRIERDPDYQVQDASGIWYPHVGDSFNQRGVTLSPGEGAPLENHPPVANAGPDREVNLTDGTVQVQLDGSASTDPDGDALSYSWSWDGHTASGEKPTISLGQGTHTITLTVTDDGIPNLSDQDTVDITVNKAHRPTAAIDSITPFAGSSLSFHKTDWKTAILFAATATDDQGHGLTYHWHSSLDGEVFPDADEFTFYANNLTPGKHVISLWVTCSVGGKSQIDTYPEPIIISELPTLSIEDASVDWKGDGTPFNALATVTSRVKAAAVQLDEVQYELSPGADPPCDSYRDGDDIYPNGYGRPINLYHTLTWKWCPSHCLTPPEKINIDPKKFDYQVKAYVTDEHGYEFWLPQYSTSCYLSVDIHKQNEYRQAATEYAAALGSTAAVPGCAALGPWGVICASILFALEATGKHLGDMSCDQAKDPWLPDPNFQQEIFAYIPLIDPGLVCETDIDDYGKFWYATNDVLRLGASAEALYATIPKMLGAAEAFQATRDPVADAWTQTHSADALRFGVWTAEDLEQLAHSLSEVKKQLSSLTAEDINDFQEEVRTSGFPEGEILLFEQLGLTEADINDLRDTTLAADPCNIVYELQTDREAELRRGADFFRGVAAAVWPLERLAIAITSPREDGWVREWVEVRVTGWNTSYFPVVDSRLEINGEVYGLDPFSWDTTVAPDGAIDITATVIPQFGPPVVDMITVTVDNTWPEITITSPIAMTYSPDGNAIPLEYSVTDNLDTNPRLSCVLLDGEPLTAEGITRQPGHHELVIKAVDAAGNYGEASISFDVSGRSVTVERPNGGETWYIDQSEEITWLSSNAGSYIKIEISRNGGSSWSTIVNSTDNDGTYAWDVSGPASADCRVKISSTTYPDVNDISNADFTIAQLTYTLSVTSSPEINVLIEVLPEPDATTPFDREYESGTIVSLTAPARYGEYFFDRWRLDGENQLLDERTLEVIVDANRAAGAIYGICGDANHPYPVGDLSQDCYVNWIDAGIFVSDWLASDYVADGLLLHWAFDEGSGGTVVDSSLNDHNGASSGATWTSPGYDGIGYCLSFNGVDDYVLDDDAGDYLNGLGALTVSVWVKSNVTGTDKGFIICEDPDREDRRNMRYDAAGFYGGGTDLIKVGVTSTGGVQELESSSSVQTTEWQHVAMTWSSGEQVALYINGELDTPMVNAPAASGTLTGYTKLLVGKGCKGPISGSWNGLIDDVRIYDFALSSDEVVTVMNGGTLGEHYYPLQSAANLYDDNVVDFKDYSLLAEDWLEEGLWL